MKVPLSRTLQTVVVLSSCHARNRGYLQKQQTAMIILSINAENTKKTTECHEKILSSHFSPNLVIFLTNRWKPKNIQSTFTELITIKQLEQHYVWALFKKWLVKNTSTYKNSYPLIQRNGNLAKSDNQSRWAGLGAWLEIVTSLNYRSRSCLFWGSVAGHFSVDSAFDALIALIWDTDLLFNQNWKSRFIQYGIFNLSYHVSTFQSWAS